MVRRGVEAASMQKSLFSKDYELFVRALREARERAGVTQVEMAKRLGETQSFISKCERGHRRVDVVELRAWCGALGLKFSDFVRELDRKVGKR
jgi:transcriptional regulator with XRE-family HTH domain